MIEEKVFAIISEQFDVDKASLSLETDLVNDLHADSLDLVELIMAFEDEFDISIPDEAALTVRTLGDAVNYISSAK